MDYTFYLHFEQQLDLYFWGCGGMLKVFCHLRYLKCSRYYILI